MINHYIELHEYINENIYKFTNDTEVLTEAIDWNKFGVIGKGIKAIIDFIIKLFGKNNTASNGSLKQIRDEQANVIKESLVKLQMPQELMDTANKFANIQDYAGKSFSNLNNIDDVANLIGKSVAGMPAMIKKVNVFSTEFLGHMFSQIVNKDKKKDDKGTKPKYAIDDETILKLSNDQCNNILAAIAKSEKIDEIIKISDFKIDMYKELYMDPSKDIKITDPWRSIFATFSYHDLVSMIYIMIRLLGLKNNFIYVYLPTVLRNVIKDLKLNDQPIISDADYENLGKLAKSLNFDASKGLFKHTEIEYKINNLKNNIEWNKGWKTKFEDNAKKEENEAKEYENKANNPNNITPELHKSLADSRKQEAERYNQQAAEYDKKINDSQNQINDLEQEKILKNLKQNLNYFAYFYRDILIDLFGVKTNEDVMTNIGFEIMFICAKYDQDLNTLIEPYKNNRQELINKLEYLDKKTHKKNPKFDETLNDQLNKILEKYTKIDEWLKNPFGQAKIAGSVLNDVFKPEMREQIANGLINQDKEYFQKIDQIVQKCFNDLMERVKSCDLKIMAIYNAIRAYYDQNKDVQVDPELQKVLTLVMTEEGNMNNYKTLMDGLCRKLSEDEIKNIPEFMK